MTGKGTVSMNYLQTTSSITVYTNADDQNKFHHGGTEELCTLMSPTRTSSHICQKASSYNGTSLCVYHRAVRTYEQHANYVRFIPSFCNQWISYDYITSDTCANVCFVFTSRRLRITPQAYHM